MFKTKEFLIENVLIRFNFVSIHFSQFYFSYNETLLCCVPIFMGVSIESIFLRHSAFIGNHTLLKTVWKLTDRFPEIETNDFNNYINPHESIYL